MEAVALQDLQTDSLTLCVENPNEAGRIEVTWRGKANERRPAATLNPFFEAVIFEAEQQQRGLELHFEGLEHFNSSTIAVLMQLVQRLNLKQIPITMTYDGTQKWQKMTFGALEQLTGRGSMLELKAL